MYNPCHNCPRPNVVRVNEGRKPFFPEKNEDYYDPLVCPQRCVPVERPVRRQSCWSRSSTPSAAPERSQKKKGEMNHGQR